MNLCFWRKFQENFKKISRKFQENFKKNDIDQVKAAIRHEFNPKLNPKLNPNAEFHDRIRINKVKGPNSSRMQA